MLVPMSALALTLLIPTEADACTIDGCALPEALHKVEGKETPANGIWTWLHHDLAAARVAIRSGHSAHALEIVHTLDKVLRARVRDLVNFGGAAAVKDFHQALQSVVLDAGGWPLEELDVGVIEAQG